MVSGWYGGGERLVEISTATSVWRHGGMPIVPIRWVLVRDPLGRFDPQALLRADPAHDPTRVRRWFVQRWRVEGRWAKKPAGHHAMLQPAYGPIAWRHALPRQVPR